MDDNGNVIQSGEKRFQTAAYSVKDKDLLYESLRERCLYNIVKNQDKSQIYRLWYNYMVLMQEIVEIGEQLDEGYSEKAFDKLKIDYDDI